MSETEDARAERAARSPEQEIPLYLHDPSTRVIRGLLSNPVLNEEHVLILAGRKNLPAEVLHELCKDRRWTDSYTVRLALARNPKTPLAHSLAIARFLRLFDLADLARNPHLPVVYRKKVASIVIEKIPTLALGIKKTLAKVAGGEILLALIQDGYPEVVRQCLDNPNLVEAHLYRVISRKTTTAGTIRTIADHRTWTFRYHIKFALLRNEHTPLARSVVFLSDIRTADLKELYRDPHLPSSVRPFVHRELLERGEDPEMLGTASDEPLYELVESELDDAEDAVSSYEVGGDEGAAEDRGDTGTGAAGTGRT